MLYNKMTILLGDEKMISVVTAWMGAMVCLLLGIVIGNFTHIKEEK